MNQSNQSKQVLLSVIGVAILVVAVVGVSFAFFNYTRTGTANTVETGKIKFNSVAGEAIELRNVFPISSTALATDEGNHAQTTVTIVGETTYSKGLDWKVTAQEVNFKGNPESQNTTALPVNVKVEFAAATGKTIGEAKATIGTNETTDCYKLYQYDTGTALQTGDTLAEGHIANSATYSDGTRYSGILTIKAYLDASQIAITDTLVGETYDGGTNGTTGNPGWVGTRTRLTTEQWNALAQYPLSFKVKVESRETGGTWVS